MTILDFSDKQLVTLGDVHGNFKSLFHALRQTLIDFNNQNSNSESKRKRKKNKVVDINNKVFIICGDCGFGFEKLEYYQTTLVNLNNFLRERNSFLIGVRGNHDNPEYFNTDKYPLNLSNIILVADYTVLKTESNNTLCIGGAVSHDRGWRVEEQERINRYRSDSKRFIYWAEENVYENSELLSELKKEGILIDSIITHAAPIRVFPINEHLMDEIDQVWGVCDEKLHDDIITEEKLLKQIYENLVADGHDVKWWCCGHYHLSHISKIPNHETTLIILNQFNGRVSLKQVTIHESSEYGYVFDVKSTLKHKQNEPKDLEFDTNLIDSLYDQLITRNDQEEPF